MKYIIVPNNINELDLYKNKGADTFIFGLDNYAINYPTISIDDIRNISSENNIFIAINKNIFNSEIEDLKEKLIELSKLPILGVLYYDIGVLNLVMDNNVNINLVWNQTHMVANYNTCNYYYSKGVKYGFLANEITLNEMLEIKAKTKMKLMVQVFGYPIMSHSRRNLLTNYFRSINKKKENRAYHLTEKDNSFLIKESDNGTSILLEKLINGTKPLYDLIDNDFEYAVLDMQEVPFELGSKVFEKFLNINSYQKENLIKEMNDLIGDNTNFFYKKTIYKVKRGDK